MRLAATVTVLYAGLVLSAGFLAFSEGRGAAVLFGTFLVGGVLLAAGVQGWKGRIGAGYLSGFVVFLSAIYFAHRFIVTEQFVPGGVLLMLSFITLFFILLGVFLGLQDR
jgi:hypothetical protein